MKILLLILIFVSFNNAHSRCPLSVITEGESAHYVVLNSQIRYHLEYNNFQLEVYNQKVDTDYIVKIIDHKISLLDGKLSAISELELINKNGKSVARQKQIKIIKPNSDRWKEINTLSRVTSTSVKNLFKEIPACPSNDFQSSMD